MWNLGLLHLPLTSATLGANVGLYPKHDSEAPALHDEADCEAKQRKKFTQEKIY